MSIIVPPELRRLARIDTAAVRKAAVQTVQASAPDARKPPKFGGITAVSVRRTANGWVVTEGGVVAHGAEFGGRRRPKRTYVTHRKGSTYTVRRRTTMQFLPWAGTHGYAIMPAMRSSMRGIRKRILEAVARAVARG